MRLTTFLFHAEDGWLTARKVVYLVQIMEVQMREERIWREYAALPPELQKQVADFITFLRTRYVPPRVSKPARRKLANEPFIGMWQNREDMQDSSAWVRRIRQSEWMSHRA